MAEIFSKIFISGTGAVLAEADKIRGAWKTYADSASLADVPITIVSTGQIAYVNDEDTFYIATVNPDPSPTKLPLKILPEIAGVSTKYTVDPDTDKDPVIPNEPVMRADPE